MARCRLFIGVARPYAETVCHQLELSCRLGRALRGQQSFGLIHIARHCFDKFGSEDVVGSVLNLQRRNHLAKYLFYPEKRLAHAE